MPTTKSKAVPTWTVHRGEDYAEIQKADGTVVFQVMSVYPDEEGDEIMRDLTTAAAAPDLLAAGNEISRIAGQLNPHEKSPVLIPYDAIIALRAALDKAEGRA